jgi:arsenate reductase-like glutaredoxin family protein
MRFSGGNPENLIDKKKPSYRALGLGDKKLSAAEAIDLMGKNPSIIRRPIFDIDGDVMIGYKEPDLVRKLS